VMSFEWDSGGGNWEGGKKAFHGGSRSQEVEPQIKTDGRRQRLKKFTQEANPQQSAVPCQIPPTAAVAVPEM
jgi:hypothetical protein